MRFHTHKRTRCTTTLCIHTLYKEHQHQTWCHRNIHRGILRKEETLQANLLQTTTHSKSKCIYVPSLQRIYGRESTDRVHHSTCRIENIRNHQRMYRRNMHTYAHRLALSTNRMLQPKLRMLH